MNKFGPNFDGRFECMYCGGTGLYQGFAEPKGTAVVCNRCGGTGHMDNGKKPFTGRKRKRGIRRVINDGGLWMMRGPKTPSSISVDEFYKKTSL